MANRRSQDALKRPLKRQPRSQRFVGYANDRGPLADRVRPAIEGQVMVPPRVVVLIGACRPSTIVRRIRTVVINAVERVVRRGTRTHVANKGRELVPRLADDDPARPIVGEVLHPGIMATAFHSLPHAVFFRARAAMRSGAAAFLFSVQAAATPRPCATQRGSSDGRQLPALATTTPVQLIVSNRRSAKHGQSSHDATSHVLGGSSHRLSISQQLSLEAA